MDSRKQLLESAQIAEQAELYEDMVKIMKELVQVACDSGEVLSKDERNLLSVAYKNAVGSRRSAWRAISAVEERQEGSVVELAKKYKVKIAEELRTFCNDVMNIIEKLIDVVEHPTDESKLSEVDKAELFVFYVKMKGDYYRYLAEVNEGKDRDTVVSSSGEAYKKALERAKDKLVPTHPIRLGLALNYSVFHYEILNSPKEACELAKSSFDEAIAELDKVKEDVYKDSTLIMQLLRDNLTLWTDAQVDDGDD